MVSFIRIQDIADIIIMTFFVYQLYSWFRHTHAFQVLIGLIALGILYIATRNLDMYMTSWVLQELGTVLFILIIVVFQSEIRQALYKFSMLRKLLGSNITPVLEDTDTLSETVFNLAKTKTGALIVFERTERLDDLLLHGIHIDSVISNELLITVFQKDTPLHDGAVIIRGGKISEASAHLPLSTASDLPQYFGTRHRAAVGITEKSDAVVVVVSEESGEVSFVVDGELRNVRTVEELSAILKTYLFVSSAKNKLSLKRILFRDFGSKFVILLLVIAGWIVINFREGSLQTDTAPITFHNLPANLLLKSTTPDELEVQLKVVSSIFPSNKEMDINADIDLSKIHDGTNTIPVGDNDFKLPLGVTISRVTPQSVKVLAERKIQAVLPVNIRKKAGYNSKLHGRVLLADPAKVIVEGAESEVSKLTKIDTEELNFNSLTGGKTELKLIPPSPGIKILSGGMVSVKIIKQKQ
ncbi:MAG: diadenylate cyclase CdaA [Desulfuromonadales bacterium]|nr:diadenylate cyclase CdaA [Desulfuromonadales bacterium]